MKSLSVTIQVKATEQYFPVVVGFLYAVQDRVVLAFECAYESSNTTNGSQ